ncbi:MAG TPA: hypothetical protein VL443_23995 [Cyclobacteriaceae bacterium]|jgi:hypothetical protein|nr:hypothetical protein [Cyclobacteriaceae bacterium]
MSEEIAKIIDSVPEYKKILRNEPHHKHEIIIDDDDVIRWKANPSVRKLIDDSQLLNEFLVLFNLLGVKKNHELYRKLYRDMGYSLSGYHEIFYWDVNNPFCDDYKANALLV